MTLAIAQLAPTPRRRSPPAPFTLRHFMGWASDLILDTGESWHPESFQQEMVKDIFGGWPEVWVVIPEGNGKTTLMAGLALYHCEHRPFAVVPVAAASREQAEIMYRQAEGFVLRSEPLHAGVHSAIQAAKGKRKTTVPRFVCLEGYRRINHHAGGRIQVFAADDRTGDGVIPTLGIIDEPHRQRDLSLYRTWSGKLQKRDGQIVAISTAGEPGSDFELTRERIRDGGKARRKGSHLRVEADRIVLHEWAITAEADPTDMRAVKRANPFSGITTKTLRQKHESPTMTPAHWARFVCNRPTSIITSWLGDDAAAMWAALAEPSDFTDGAPTYLGVDIALKHDTSAVVALQQRDDGRWHAKARIWTPTDDQPVDVTDVMQYIREVDQRYDLQAVSFDPRFFDVPAKMLGDEGILMVELPQSIERMTMAVGGLYEAVMRSEITHDGDELFATHVINAVPRYNDRGFTLTKSKSRGKIDACIALALAYDRVQRTDRALEPMVRFGR